MILFLIAEVKLYLQINLIVCIVLIHNAGKWLIRFFNYVIVLIKMITIFTLVIDQFSGYNELVSYLIPIYENAEGFI